MILLLAFFTSIVIAACPVPQFACNRVCPDVETTCPTCAIAQTKGLQCCPEVGCGCGKAWFNADGTAFTGECSIGIVIDPIICSCPPATKEACEKIDGKVWVADPAVDPTLIVPTKTLILPTKLILPEPPQTANPQLKRCSCIKPIGGSCQDKLVTLPPIVCKCPTKSQEQIDCEAKIGFKWVVKSDVPVPAPKDVPTGNVKRCSCIALPAGVCTQISIDITLPPCDCRSDEQRKCESTLGGTWVVSGGVKPLPGPEVVPPKETPTTVPSPDKQKRCSCVQPQPGQCVVKPIIEPCLCPVAADVSACITNGKIWAADTKQVLPTVGVGAKVKRCTCATPPGKCIEPICACPAVVAKCQTNEIFVAARTAASTDNSVCKCDLGRCTPVDVPVPIYCQNSKCLHTAISCAAIKGVWTDASPMLTDKIFNAACGCGVCNIKKVFEVTVTGNADLKTALAGSISNGNLNVMMNKNGVATVEVSTDAGASGDGSSDSEIIASLKASGAVSDAKLVTNEIGAVTDAPSHSSSSAGALVVSALVVIALVVANAI